MANRVNVDLDMNVQGYVQGINQATESTKAYETETKKVQDSVGNFRKEFAAAKKEAMNLAAAYRNLSAEEKNSQFGKEMAKQLEAAKQKASELLDVQSDMQQELKNLASDTATFDSLSQGMNVFMQTTSAALGMVAQFTGNEEDARKAVVMFTTAQSTLNAVTQIQNALQGQSALMLGVTKVQTLAATAAENLSTAAKSKNIVVTKAATIAQAAFNKVAMANPYVLLATAIIAVGAALYGLISWMNSTEEAEKRETEQAEKNKQAHEHQRDAMINASSSATAMATDLQDLREQYLNTNNEIEKTSILEAAAKHFKSLGMECNNLGDAQKILVENGSKVIKLIDLQGEAAAINALKIERLTAVIKELMDAGMSLSQARILAREDGRYKALRGESQELQKQTAELQKQLKITSKTFGSGSKGSGSKKPTIDYDKGSLADLENQLTKLQEKLKKKNMSLIDKQKTIKDVEDLKKQIEDKKIELGMKEPELKDIENTEAWYRNQIKKLEEQKAKLPINAYIERQKLQDQIDNMNLKLKLELEGVEITGSKDLAEAFNGTYEKSINGINDSISALQNKLKDTDWSTMGEDGSKEFYEYIQKIQELKAELSELQEVYDEQMLTPQEKALKQFEEMQEAAEKTGEDFRSLGSITGSIGDIFKSMGNDAAAAALQVITATLDMMAQIIPQILGLIGAKQAEAMASGTASAAKLPYPANLGAIASIIATVLSTFATISSVISGAESHAGGGIVGGSSFHGDRILSYLDSGEMVLNKRQQNSLFNFLDGGLMPQRGGQNVKVTGVIRGTDLMLVQKNTNKVLRKTGTSINF